MNAELYRIMRLIRRFEERAIELVRSGDIIGGIHPYIGQEAIAAGVCAALRPDDIITSTHRGHGHVLAKGADPARMLAELCGRSTGLNQGRGGSMHAADLTLGIYGANGIVGAGGPIAVGAAWAHRMASRERAADGFPSDNAGPVAGDVPVARDGDVPVARDVPGNGERVAGGERVAVSFFGDGAVNQGVFLESLNLAALWRLPVLFVCENNGYATTLTVDQAVAGTITGRATAFGISTSTVDGMDAEAVRDAAGAAVARLRDGDGPAFLECHTYRFDAHHTWEHQARANYRNPDEVAAGRARDPLTVIGDRLPPEVRAEIDARIEAVLIDAVDFARNSPRPDPKDALRWLYGSGLQGRGCLGEGQLPVPRDSMVV